MIAPELLTQKEAPEKYGHEAVEFANLYLTRFIAPECDMSEDHPDALPTDLQLRVTALATVLAEKKMVEQETLDAIVENYEKKVGPRCGAQVVARAWTDDDYRRRLLEDGPSAIAEMGFAGFAATHMMVKENTPAVHNLVVCTLCSCYPWATLGLPPRWYKSAPYRSRAVRDPRGLLKDFGLTVADNVQIRVWDSTAETRYLVLPMRPAGTEGMSVEQLASLVTRDAMIGTAVVTCNEP
jgi:nitrile hydratase subunit alpha